MGALDEIRSSNNVVYRCTYHVVCCPKYLRKVIEGAVDDRLQQIIREVCAERYAQFPAFRSRIPTLWTNSYFVATVGGATLDIVKHYIANQRSA